VNGQLHVPVALSPEKESRVTIEEDSSRGLVGCDAV
jgi:hypothetical protein